MTKKPKKQWRLRDVMGFSKYIYAAMLILAVAAMIGMSVYGVIKNPKTFENVVIKKYETNGIGLASARYEKDGEARELTVAEALELLAPYMDKKIKEQKAMDSNLPTEYKITFISDITEDNGKKSAPTLELTFAGDFCMTTDLHYGGDHIYWFKD